ncbi:hypothetical protein C7212DRAFT_307587, partial [Tuber magnatum]
TTTEKGHGNTTARTHDTIVTLRKYRAPSDQKGSSDLPHDSCNDSCYRRYITATRRSRAAEKQQPPSIRSGDELEESEEPEQSEQSEQSEESDMV